MFRFYFYVVFCFMIFFSCHTQKKIKFHQASTIYPAIILQKNPCFGRCATFKITIYNNGLAILDAKDNIEKKGIFSTRLDPNGLQKSLTKKATIDWSKYNKEYILNLPDLSSTELKIFDEKGVEIKRIFSNKTLPDELDKFQRNISELIKDQNWIAMQKKSETEHPENYTADIQLVLDSTQTMDNLKKEFAYYELVPKTKISIYMEHWLVTYNQEKIDKFAMLALLRNHPGIVTASFNRMLEER